MKSTVIQVTPEKARSFLELNIDNHVNPLLRDVINDFGAVFSLQSFPSIRSEK